MGDTTANVAQTASVALPAGAGTWQADLLTREGYGAGVDQHGNPGISGLSVQSTDGLNALSFSVFDDFSLNVGTTVNGEWQGWTRVGVAAPVIHRGGPEMLWHTYNIQLNADGTFAVLFDGNMLRDGISAGPASAWADGIGTGTLFTLSNLDGRHLSTYFDNVRALGLADASHTPAGTSSSQEPLIATGLLSPAVADAGLNTGTTEFHQVATVKSAGPSGLANEGTATARALIWVPVARAELSGSAGAGHSRAGEIAHSTSSEWEILVSPWWALQDFNL